MSFYFLQLMDKPDVPVAEGADDPDRDLVLAEPGVISGWDAPTLRVPRGVPSDYLANDLGLRLCSERMRTVLEQAAGPDDRIQWLPAKVEDANGSEHEYWVLHMIEVPDLLDAERSIVVRGSFVVKPVVAGERVGSHIIFSFLGATTRLIVAESTKRSLQGAACSGIDFAKVAVA